MPPKIWKVVVHLREGGQPQVILRSLDEQGRLSHLLVADKLFEPIGDLIDNELNTPRTGKEIQEKEKGAK